MIQVEKRTGKQGEGSWLLLSGEWVLWALIVLLAATLRLSNLGTWPLLMGEAAQAWGAWDLLQSGTAATPGYSPLLLVLNLFGFFSFGASDAIARLWPALLGTGLVILPFFLRTKLGRAGALVASFLLAVSPMFLYFSRTLDGNIAGMVGMPASIIALAGFEASREPRYVTIAVLAVALGLMSEVGFYTCLVALIAFFIYGAWDARRRPDNSLADSLLSAWTELASDKALLRKAGILLGGLVLLGSSALFLNATGWQATLNVVGRWLGQFSRTGHPTTWLYYVRLLATYETLPLVVGLVGAGLSLRKRDWFAALLVIWFLVALVLHSAAADRTPGAVLTIALPLILLAARALDALLAFIRSAEIDAYSWLFLGVAAILLSYLYLQMVGFTFGGDTRYQALLVIAGVGLLACFAVFWYWVGSSQALPVGAVVLLLLLTAYLVHSSVQLNYFGARDATEPVNQAPTSVDILNVTPFLADMSGRLTRDARVMPILVENRLKPVLAWYTRGFSNVHFANSAPNSPEERAVVVLASEGGEGPSQYVGQRFRLYEESHTQDLGWGDWAKWLLRRYKIGTMTSTDIQVWVRP